MQPELFPCASNCRLFKLTIKSSVSQLSRARPHRCTKAHTMDKLAQFFKENIISKYFWKYTLTFLANQCGSLTYILAVQGANLSVAVPVANGLKFAFTSLMGRMLGEKELSWTKSLGVVLILAGVLLQMS